MDLDFKNIPQFTLSANEIRIYCDCPRKRYYSSRDCLAIRTNVKNKNLELGRAIHLTIAYLYLELDKKIKELGIVEPELEQCQELLNTIPDFQLLSAEEGGATLDVADKQVYDNMISCYKPQIAEDLVDFEIIGCEEPFNLDNWPIENVRYHGNVDMTVRSRFDHLIYFFEHKTCRDFRPEIYDRFDIQLHIYAAYGCEKYGAEFGGMILNQLKKAKTSRGYAHERKYYPYTLSEMIDFTAWLTAKTKAVVSPDNVHEPCNNYMSCKMCEYSPICLKYGYSVPHTTQEVIENADFTMEDVNEETKELVTKPMFRYDPRETTEEEE